MTSQHQQMREAINAVELALNGLEIDAVVRQWEGAADSVMVKVPLGALRQLGRCYPELNRIINDPTFEKQSHEPDHPMLWDSYANRYYEPVELRAAKIYERFDYDGPGKKPDWQPHGNSTKQDDARSIARRLLREAGHKPRQRQDKGYDDGPPFQ